MGEERLSVSACKDLAEASLTATSPAMFGDDEGKFLRLMDQTSSNRFGMDAYGFCTLARGRVDVAVEANLKPYDYMAPTLIVQEAGGVMTDWAGQSLGLQSDGRVVAGASAELHAAALATLSG